MVFRFAAPIELVFFIAFFVLKSFNSIVDREKLTSSIIYEKEFICKRLQPHYTIADLMEIYSVSRDTILRALQEEKVKTHRIRRTILVPASEIPKIIKDV